jgi:hypothetical protein
MNEKIHPFIANVFRQKCGKETLVCRFWGENAAKKPSFIDFGGLPMVPKA